MDKKPNRLIDEKSPYLLQHAHNPVEWYPWGEEAFARARAEDKPVFLSIGYSTCHWCHVMERESFEDREVADFLNDNYVAVKVDREERPDVDHIYMSVCQAMTGSGGWPLTVILSADKKPFFAGTYFPKTSRWGRPGLMEILAAVRNKWVEDKADILQHTERIMQLFDRQAGEVSAGRLTGTVLAEGYSQLERDFDRRCGGFGQAPKFPTPHNLLFLLRHWRFAGEKKALAMVERTLDAMRRGGIYDHLGGGFARYSTDEKWLVPHFEKMAYDNALLCYTYLEAYQCTGNKDFARVAEEIAAYVLRDMTGPEGEFYSAEDADSEGVEGKFYVWTKQEIMGLLGAEDGAAFCEYYDVTDGGNFEDANILNTIHKDAAPFAARQAVESETLELLLARSRRKLFDHREKRVHPLKDDKVLTAWNALMIAAIAKAARVLEREDYAAAARRALDFVLGRLIRPADGRLLARYREGEAAYPAYIDDYAFLLWAMVELFETTQQPWLLKKAAALAADMIRLFWDEDRYGFFFCGADSEDLIARPKELYDGAMPSGNSVAAYALLRLARLTDDREMEGIVAKMVSAFAGEVNRHPRAHTFFLMALQGFLAPPRHLVIAGDRDDPLARQLWREASHSFIPDTLVVFCSPAESGELAEVVPVARGKTAAPGKAAAYLCENFACQLPVTDVGELREKLSGPLS
ncbi:MAG: thioredoxin domain-containing protein [Negativicutes bacterium]|nr:thioredoxin domain-containing protein [Negativicutes bacterium]